VPNNSVPITLGEAMRRARKTAGCKQDRVAEYCGASRQLVSRWEAGTSVPSFLQMQKFVQLTDARWLLETDFSGPAR
jgi:transcriptional regulator with XRE-family HTH domain